MGNFFGPEEYKELFLTAEDQAIVRKDIPERLQHQLSGREITSDHEELVEEAIWVYNHLSVKKNLVLNSVAGEKFKLKILKVLEFMRISFYEVSTSSSPLDYVYLDLQEERGAPRAEAR